MRIIDLSVYAVKEAADPRIEAALKMGLVGAGAGGLLQGIRKLLHRGDPEDSPSILNGMLLGGGLGAAGGAGLSSWMGMQPRSRPGAVPLRSLAVADGSMPLRPGEDWSPAPHNRFDGMLDQARSDARSQLYAPSMTPLRPGFASGMLDRARADGRAQPGDLLTAAQ